MAEENEKAAIQAVDPDRVRWDDEEMGQPPRRSLMGHRPSLRRVASTESMAIKRVSSRNQVDPAITLPIQYRTV
jgi:hypothetical protein